MFQLLPQILINTLVAGSVYALVASGLTLIFGVLKFVNFGYAEFMILCGYIYYMLLIVFEFSAPLSVVLTLIIASLVSLIIERLTYRPVSNSGEFTPLMVSIGVGLIIKSIIEVAFGTRLLNYDAPSTDSLTIFNSCTENCLFLPASITILQVIIIITSLLTFVLLFLFLFKTKTGKAIRAMSDNQDMAKVLGVKTVKMNQIVFILTALLGCIGGILLGYEYYLHTNRSVSFGIKAFSAVILGGQGSLKGAVIGAFIIAFSENLLTVTSIISNGYKDAVAFFILTIVLIIRPQGLFGGGKEKLSRKE